jgi:phage shock protein A
MPKMPSGICKQRIRILEKIVKDMQTELDQLRDSYEELHEKYKNLQEELLFKGLNINRS